MRVGDAWAIIKGRKYGSREFAEKFLQGIPPEERKERNRQEARAKGSTSTKPYRLGEKVRNRNG